MPELRADEIVRLMVKHGVQFVIIGGVAGNMDGSHLLTRDFDMVPAKDDEENLDRLNKALLEIHTKVRWAFAVRNIGGGWLRSGNTWNLETDFGYLDILFAPAGIASYEDLVARAQ